MRRSRKHAPSTWTRDPRITRVRRRRHSHAARRFDPHRVHAPYFLQDGGGHADERRRGDAGWTTSRRGLAKMRAHPLRTSLIGIAAAGVAVPMAHEGIAAATDRMDRGHERTVSFAPPVSASDEAVSERWRMQERDRVIDEALDRYSDYPLDRALAEAIHDAAVDSEVNPETAFGLVRAESGFRNNATSVVGAIGITQLMPATAEWMEPGVSQNALRDPGTNAEIGFRYLRYLIDKYDGSEDLALLAYNRGPGTVDRLVASGADPDNGYAAFVRGEAGHGHTLFSGG
jgi:soluble lytic murein transglycosylase-like protein